MLRIDAHHHYWRYQPQDYPWIDDDMPQLRRDFYPPQLQPLLAQHRLDGAVVVQARHDENETAWLVAQVSQAAGVCGVVGWLDITAADLEDKLTQWRGQLCGLRHQVQDEADPAAWLEREAVSRGMQQLQRQGYSWICWLPIVISRRRRALPPATMTTGWCSIISASRISRAARPTGPNRRGRWRHYRMWWANFPAW